MNEADAAAWDAGGYVILPQLTMTGPIEEVSASIRKLIDNGATEIQFQPAGKDIAREIDRFMTAARQA